jgi:hypothetical protein
MTQTILDFETELYQEHLEEVSFLYELRLTLFDDPEITWLDISDFEERFEAHIDALVVGEGPAFYLGEQDNRFFKTALSLISTGKSFALSGLSGAGKSTLIHYILSRLDVTCYRPSLVHYGGLQRNSMLKALADVLGVDTNGRTVPLLINLQGQRIGVKP